MADLPADIEQLLAQTRQAQQPTAADRARIGRQLAAKLSVPAAASFTAEPKSPPPSAAASRGPWALTAPAFKLTLAVVLGAAAATSWVVVSRDRVHDRAARQVKSTTGERTSQVEATPADQPLVAAAASAAPTARTAWPAALAERPEQERQAVGQAAASLAARAADRESAAQGRRRAVRSSGSLGKPAALAAANAQPQPSAAETNGLARELSLTRAAARALDASVPARALRLTEQHTREFPHGALSPERDALRIAALCALDRRTEAAALRRQFDARDSTSPLRVRIAQHCDAPATRNREP
jgi:hypothetical protein